MVTVPQATEKIIKRSRYLSEAMSKDLINAASLARYIQPEVEEMTFKKVTQASIMMAIKRLRAEFTSHQKTVTIFQEPPDMIVRSNLTLWFIQNSPTLLKKLSHLEDESIALHKKVLFTYGRVETTILANRLLSDPIEIALQNETITRSVQNVSAITIHLPVSAVDAPGIYNFFIKSLSWEGIAILGMLSTQTELTLMFTGEDSNTAFSILQSLFSN
jgi:hypothetical protein